MPQLSEPATSSAPCVLVIEDDSMVATLIAEILAEAGFRVAGMASTASEAMSIAQAQQCDLALIDIRLPGERDGVDIAVELRQRFDIGAIFLSGTSDPDDVARAAGTRPYGFLQKPFLPSQMYKALSKAMDQRRQERV